MIRNTVRIIILSLALAFALPAGNAISGSISCPSSGRARITPASALAVTYTLQAPEANTGKVYVGGSTVTTSIGFFLKSGDSFTAPSQGNAAAYNLMNTYISCTASGDTITFTYFQ